jgi:ABC-type transporter Mla subunit MlaD
VDSAREAILEALNGLPRDADYAPVAAQLRELATVSPSLMEWLREVPKVATPLAEALRNLHQAAADLTAASDLLRSASG